MDIGTWEGAKARDYWLDVHEFMRSDVLDALRERLRQYHYATGNPVSVNDARELLRHWGVEDKLGDLRFLGALFKFPKGGWQHVGWICSNVPSNHASSGRCVWIPVEVEEEEVESEPVVASKRIGAWRV